MEYTRGTRDAEDLVALHVAHQVHPDDHDSQSQVVSSAVSVDIPNVHYLYRIQFVYDCVDGNGDG